jgi:hypothetical protein
MAGNHEPGAPAQTLLIQNAVEGDLIQSAPSRSRELPGRSGVAADTVEYFLGDLAPLFKLPDWMANLSVFHLYGNPVVGGPPWTPAVSMLLVFLVGFGAALVLMRRRDVSSA